MTKENLKNLINDYAEQNSLFNATKKVVGRLKSEIEEAFGESKISEFDTGDFTAILSTVEKQSFNEELMIPIIKTFGVRGVVKKKEYVDMDALEKAIYSGKITAEQVLQLDKCKETTSSQRLTIKKNKRGK